MKKLLTFLTLALLLGPTTVLADSTEAGQKATLSGNNSFLGSVTAYNLNPPFASLVPSQGQNLSFGALGDAYTLMLMTNQSLLAAAQSPQPGLVALIPITGFNIECLPFNPALVGTTSYPYVADTNGIGGGTVVVHEYKPTGAAVTVATLVFPDSPHNGPYVNKVNYVLNAPYVPTSGSVFDAQVTVINNTTTSTYGPCVITATLQ